MLVSRIFVIGVVYAEVEEPSDVAVVANVLDCNVDRSLEGFKVLVCEIVDVSGSIDEDVV